MPLLRQQKRLNYVNKSIFVVINLTILNIEHG